MVKKENRKYLEYMIEYLKDNIWFGAIDIAREYIVKEKYKHDSNLYQYGKIYRLEIKGLAHILASYIGQYKQCGFFMEKRMRRRGASVYRCKAHFIQFLKDFLKGSEYIKNIYRDKFTFKNRDNGDFKYKSRHGDTSGLMFFLGQQKVCTSHFRELYNQVECECK